LVALSLAFARAFAFALALTFSLPLAFSRPLALIVLTLRVDDSRSGREQ
jgi:hypothetical protein